MGAFPQTFKDQIGRTIKLPNSPKRIISLVPSQTELLFDLGLDEEVIAITKFCVRPDKWFRNKPRIGGTKTIDFQKIRDLSPDLIIGNKEENEKLQIEELSKHYPVWMSDVQTLNDVYVMVTQIGEITGKPAEANTINKRIRGKFFDLKAVEHKPLKVLYLIWKDPYMAAGKNTYIDHLLGLCHLTNVLPDTRYPLLSIESLKELNPDLIFLSSEPYPFKEKHKAELQSVFPEARIYLVDGELFSWHGSRLLSAPDYFRTLLNSILNTNDQAQIS